MRRSKATVAVSAFVLAVVVVLHAPSGAQTAEPPGVIEIGWWSDLLGASADEGNLTVGEAPDGSRSVAAVRLQAANGLERAFLDLVEVDATASGVGGIVACVGHNAWQAVEGGDLEDAPRTDCEDTDVTPLVRDDTTETWSADLTAIVRNRTGEVTIVLVPDAESDGSGLAPIVPWSVELAGPPALTATQAVEPTTTTTTATTTSTTAPPTTSAASSTGATPARSSSFTAAPLPATSTTTTTLAALADLPTTTAPSTTVAVSQGFASAAPIADRAGGGRPVGQAIFFLVLSAVVGTVAGTGHWYAATRR